MLYIILILVIVLVVALAVFNANNKQNVQIEPHDIISHNINVFETRIKRINSSIKLDGETKHLFGYAELKNDDDVAIYSYDEYFDEIMIGLAVNNSPDIRESIYADGGMSSCEILLYRNDEFEINGTAFIDFDSTYFANINDSEWLNQYNIGLDRYVFHVMGKNINSGKFFGKAKTELDKSISIFIDELNVGFIIVDKDVHEIILLIYDAIKTRYNGTLDVFGYIREKENSFIGYVYFPLPDIVENIEEKIEIFKTKKIK